MPVYRTLHYSVGCDYCDNSVPSLGFKNQAAAEVYWKSIRWRKSQAKGHKGKWLCPHCQRPVPAWMLRDAD